MADTKVTALVAQTQWTAADLIYVVADGTTSKKMTLDDLFTEIIISPRIKNSNGIDIDTTDGSDGDVDLITCLVTGTPKLWWDESEDSFATTKGLQIAGGGKITGTFAGPAANEQDALQVSPTSTITDEIGRGVNVVMDWSGTYGATGFSLAGTISGVGNHDHFYGNQNWVYHTSSGTTATVAGLMAKLTQSYGTITRWVGLLLPSNTLTGGILTAAWHVYAESARRSYLPGGIVLSDALLGTAPSAATGAANGVCRIHHDYAEVSGGLSQYGVYVISTDAAAVGVGGVIAMGGESGAASTPYPFAQLIGAKEQAGAKYNGYFAIYTTDTGSNNSEKVRVSSAGNMGLGQTSFGTSATKTLAIGAGTAPASSPADAAQLYVNDQAAGNACVHTRTEGGAVIKLYQETTGVAEAAFVEGSGAAINENSTIGGYTLQQVVKALQLQGLLA